tara:strand:- start:238 stop:543 length:306 start_codon:yes stop_codon:yes gene_type:complete
MIMTKLEEIKDILETAPLDKITTQTLYDVIMEVIECDTTRIEQSSFSKLSDAMGEELILLRHKVVILRIENKRLKKKLKRSVILPKTKLSIAEKTLLKDLK